MSASTALAVTSGLLLGMLVIIAGTAHQALLDACVCVVNSAGRAAVALAVTAALGAVLAALHESHVRTSRAVEMIQVVSFITALFFLVQHVFFVLELA